MRGLLVAVVVVLAVNQALAGKKNYCAPGCKTMINALDARITELEENHDSEWTMVLRASKGDGGNIVSKWESDHAYNEDQADIAQDLTKNFNGIYKSAMADKWDSLYIEEVKVAVYTGAEQKAFFLFDGRQTTKMNFFDKSKLLASSYPRFTSEGTNFFSIKGDNGYNRHFFISKSYGGCGNDQAWFVVVDDGNVGCDWSNKEAKPYFLYSPTNTYCNMETEALIADTLAIYIKVKQM